MNNYKVVKQFFFNKETPDDLCEIICALNRTAQRVKIVYGDTMTGRLWESVAP